MAQFTAPNGLIAELTAHRTDLWGVTTAQQPFPLYGEEFKREPHCPYARLRERAPLHRVEFPSGVVGWIVTGYHAATELLTDPEMSKDHRNGTEEWRATASRMPEPYQSRMQVHLMHRDAPDHTRMRRMLADTLSPRNVERLRPRATEIAGELADRIGGEPVDLLASFAFPYAFTVLCELIGVPGAYRDRFDRRWCEAVNTVGPRHPRRAEYVGILAELDAYIAELLAFKRRAPGDDLISALIARQDAGDLSAGELSSMVFQLLIPGSGPVMTFLGNAVLTLLRHPEQLAELRADPGLLPGAVDELLRFESPFELTTWRLTKQDRRMFGGDVPAGNPVMASLAAANRDPARFDEPGTLNLRRSPNPHLAFGHGSHYCPGAALARMEGQVALRVLLTRFPGLRLAVPEEELTWTQAVLVRGLTSLPVRTC
ncbi:cytochrome P450 family protein [Amycolatopsis anabasis]|uniref:cytochrome P450 family protein n=1 Tax=Amycolatopsis anabasis TaxID=1840409 RepID=UPI00131B7B38|nr:cytochrome P450 [Amycolatopsis anabasis]